MWIAPFIVGQLCDPYPAWSNKPAAHIKKEPSAGALDVGLIREGDWIVVKGCEYQGWVALEPFGYVRRADLSTGQQAQDSLAQATFQRFHYGTALGPLKVYAEP